MTKQETAAWDELALDYHGQVITPFSSAVDFRLADDLEGFVHRWTKDRTLPRRTVIDVGVGCGESTELIAGQAGLTVAVDFSRGMLAKTSERLTSAGISHREAGGLSSASKTRRAPRPETILVQADMRALVPLRGRGDLVLAINSITGGQLTDTDAMFRNTVACTKRGGDFIGVFPSLDSFEYLISLYAKAGCAADVGEVDRHGYYEDADGDRQKFFRPDELRGRIEDAGLQVFELVKIEYPWSVIDAAGWGHFPRHRRLWDWYLWAQAR